MGNIDFILQRDELSAPTEMSSLVSPREPKGMFRNWTFSRQHGRRAGNLTNISSQLQQQFQASILGTTRMHPFQIYQYPSELRNFHNSNDWQRFKVRDGAIMFQAPVSNTSSVAGTDGACQTPFSFANSPNYPWFLRTSNIGNPPQTNQVPPTDSTSITTGPPLWNEMIIPADGNAYFVWISFCPGTFTPQACEICFGSSPTGCTGLYDGATFNDPWPSFPDNDPYHFLVGMIVYVAPYNSFVINQVQTDNILTNLPNGALFDTSSNGDSLLYERFRGKYNSSSNYWAGDVVLQTIASSAGPNWTYRWIYSPIANPTAYPIINGPISGIDPSVHHPDPWVLTGKFPVNADGTASADFNIDAAYQAAKAYIHS